MNVGPVITLMTDFGLKDPYVGMMKGVILSINPHAKIVDITHQISAQSINEAADTLQSSYLFFPVGSIHVAVVDPGVGSDRRPLLILTDDYAFIGPDNGLFWPICKDLRPVKIIHLTQKAYFLSDISPTFHGRDIFAPVAAHLSLRKDPHDMGVPIDHIHRLTVPSVNRSVDTLTGRIKRVDSFGNLVTNIHHDLLDDFLDGLTPIVRVGDWVIVGIQKTYSDKPAGEPVILIDSSGYLEISINTGRASDRLNKNPDKIVGKEVIIRKKNFASPN